MHFVMVEQGADISGQKQRRRFRHRTDQALKFAARIGPTTFRFVKLGQQEVVARLRGFILDELFEHGNSLLAGIVSRDGGHHNRLDPLVVGADGEHLLLVAF